MTETVHKLISITGCVQGVGFRPFVKRLADDYSLAGYVKNTGAGVTILVCGREYSVSEFVHSLHQDHPPAASIQALKVTDWADNTYAGEGFTIEDSLEEDFFGAIADDRAICHSCLIELQEPHDRHFRHLFIHCTQCGPRFSVIEALPYDRQRTAMQDFSQCPECQREYLNVDDRRFHAQTNACHVCGPVYWLEDGCGGFIADNQRAVSQSANLLRKDRILAVKGTGGFRLCCLANSVNAVTLLRHRKTRPAKPFAMMAKDVDVIRRYAHVSDAEAEALQDPANPIVLLQRKIPPDQSSRYAVDEAVAPGMKWLGFMLPSNAFEWLLMDELDEPVVTTSGNLGSQPQEIGNIQANATLGPLVDGIVLHNRNILQRVDDSVLRVEPDYLVLRRSKGLSNRPIMLPPGMTGDTPILAMGAAKKNTFCLLNSTQALLSSHVGDLQDVTTSMSYRSLIQRYLRLHAMRPGLVVVDAHPGYRSSQIGQDLAMQWRCNVKQVYHHHAHAAAVMAEHALPVEEKVLAIVWDGLGMGESGELWGGEFLLADYRSFQRLARLHPVALPGGDQAARQPWRNLLAHFHAANMTEWVAKDFGDLPQLSFLHEPKAKTLRKAIDQGVNSPLASSAGRLFDAVAALLNLVPETQSYEGQSALALEQAAWDRFGQTVRYYPWDIRTNDSLVEVQWESFWRALLDDLARGCPVDEMAAVFHHTLVDVMAVLAERHCREHNLDTVVFAGGVAQNALLRKGLSTRLADSGVRLLLAHGVPSNDADISLGQAVIAASQCS